MISKSVWNIRFSLWLLVTASVLACCQRGSAQRARFGDSWVIPNGQIPPPAIGNPQNPAGASQTLPTLPPGSGVPAPPAGGQATSPVMPQLLPGGPAATPTAPGGTAGQPVLMQNQTFDPFAVQPGQPGTGLVTPGNYSTNPPPYIYPPPAGGASPATLPATTPGVYQPVQQGAWANSPTSWPNEAWARLKTSPVYRVLQRPRWRQTFIGASGTDYLGWNETDLATTLSIPNFLWTSQPIRISPGFTFNFWDGPSTPVTGADLPPRTYNAYLANDFSTAWDRNFGMELNVTVGVYSDFHSTNSHSVRVTGLGLGWFRLNNTNTIKVGIEYLDRVHTKLLPAVGLFIYPTPDLKLDIYFPRPRLAQRLPNLGNYEVWGYIGGEYGGGSWTIERIGGMGDQADVNDIRAYLGVEWMCPSQVTGLFEFGYVFNRNIIYRSSPDVIYHMSDALMVRAGIAF